MNKLSQTRATRSMSKNTLYTVILDYAGGTYIGQASANSAGAALLAWISKIKPKDLAKWRLTRNELNAIAKSDEPLLLINCLNVWCLAGSARGGLVLINVVATEQRRRVTTR